MTEKMTSKIAQVTIRVSGVWIDEDGNSYVREKEFVTQIDTSTVKEFKQFDELALDVALSMNHDSICTSLMSR